MVGVASNARSGELRGSALNTKAIWNGFPRSFNHLGLEPSSSDSLEFGPSYSINIMLT